MLRLTEAEYAALTGQKVKQNKYLNNRVTVDGITFDSQKECDRWFGLVRMERCGLITDLRRQVPFMLVEKAPGRRAVIYKADATYWENGKYIVEDTKGGNATKTQAYRIKKKMMAALGYEIREV